MTCPKCKKEMIRLENDLRTIWICYEDAEIVWGNRKGEFHE